MRSIRLSLIVYFLFLLGAALGLIGWRTYRTTRQALEEKEESMRTLLLAQYEGRCRGEREIYDERILRQAQTLASLAQSQFGNAPFHELKALGALGSGFTTHGHLLLPVWLTEGMEGRLGSRFRGPPTLHIQLAEDVTSPEHEGETRGYFQIYNETGVPLQHSIDLPERVLTLDAGMREKLDLFTWQFDDAEGPGISVRRVTLKTPVTRFRFRWSWPGSRFGPRLPFTGAPGMPPPPPPTPDGQRNMFDRPAPAIFIQCACDTQQRDATLVGFEAGYRKELSSLEERSRVALADLRRQFWLTGLSAFAAAIVGGFGLVRLGLSPLHRVSEAVSQVSEKDFRLPLDAARLPVELRPIVERLTQTFDLLRGAFAREKQAAADISHELRTPLAALLATTELALRKSRSPEEYRKLLVDCHASGQQMNRLVERLLTLARLDAGVDRLHVEETDVVDLAGQCADLVRPLAQARNIELRIHGVGPLLWTLDPLKLREVVINLLHNAVEYNRPDGTIDLAVFQKSGSLLVEVRDTGAGIPDGSREHIFERFYRADPSRQADGLHAGLGLAICKSYVELMGGTITAESTSGEGSCFRVELPACR